MRRFVVYVLAAALAASCSSPSADPEPTPVTPTPTPDPPKPEVVHVESLTLPDTVYVGLAENLQIPVQVLPENATDKSLKFYNYNEKIVSIDSSGVARGLKTGTGRIVVMSGDGYAGTEAKITVVESQVALTADMVSTNSPMQYVSWGYSPDGNWDESVGNLAITEQQAAERLAKYATPENMWDGNIETEYYVNFDVYNIGKYWTTRPGVVPKYAYIQFDLGETIRLATIRFTVSAQDWFDTHGYRLEFSEDGQTYMDPDYADYNSIGLHTPVQGIPNESFVISQTTGQSGRPFRGFRIVPIHGYTVPHEHKYWGISEISITRIRI